jgi:type 1 glutamine amidotransferase
MKFFRPLFVPVLAASLLTAAGAEKKIVLVAGRQSHGMGDHEFRAGCLLLQQALRQTPGLHVTVYSNGWPSKLVDGKNADDNTVFAGADAVFLYADGGGGHPAMKPERLKFLDDFAARGGGIGCAHYAVEAPKGDPGEALLRWTGGYFETFWSVNPHWTADFAVFPKHPVTRGVAPFKINDEWYYHMRFQPEMKGVTPVLTATPPDGTRGKEGANSAHGGNPHVQARKGQPEHVMWVYDRPGGGRGFGFTGGHRHKNWADENFRRVVLNALLWIAKAEVPEGGVQSTLTPDDLAANLDPKSPPKPKPTPTPGPVPVETKK